MTLTLGGIAALCFGVALALMKKGLAKRSVVYLMLLAGMAGLGGALGAIVARIVRSGVNGATNATDRLLGTGVGGLLVILVLSIFIYPHVKPKNAQPPTRSTPWIGLAWGTVAASVGGVFAAAAGFSTNIVAQSANFLLTNAPAFFSGR
jgi:heme A synthase